VRNLDGGYKTWSAGVTAEHDHPQIFSTTPPRTTERVAV
jgi:hypothetical protein